MKKTVLLIFIFLSACQKKEETLSTITSIDGSWLSSLGCFNMGAEYSKFIVTYNSGAASSAQYFYSDAICSDVNLIYKTDSTSAYIEGGIVTSPADAKSIDATSGLLSMTAVSAAGVTSLNTSNMCGFNNWVINVPKDITGICGYGAANVVTYTIYNITGSILKFGTNSGSYNGSSNANRHNIYDPTYYFTKQ